MGGITRVSEITGIPRMTRMTGGWDARCTRMTGMSRMTGSIGKNTCRMTGMIGETTLRLTKMMGTTGTSGLTKMTGLAWLTRMNRI